MLLKMMGHPPTCSIMRIPMNFGVVIMRTSQTIQRKDGHGPDGWACCNSPITATIDGSLVMDHCCGTGTIEVISPEFQAPSGHTITSVSFSGGASANGVNSTSSNNVRFNNGGWELWSGYIPENTTTIQFKFNAYSGSWWKNITIDDFEVISSNSAYDWAYPPVFNTNQDISCFVEYEGTSLTVEFCGCMSPLACNYQSSATVDDESCVFPDETSISLFGCDSLEFDGSLFTESTTINSVSVDSTYEELWISNIYGSDSLQYFLNVDIGNQIESSSNSNVFNNENSHELWGRYYEDFSDNSAQGWSWSGWIGACCNSPITATIDGSLVMDHCCGTGTIEVISPEFQAPSGHTITSVSFSGGASANGVNSTSSNNVRFNNGGWELWSGYIPENTTTIQFKFNAYSGSWWKNITIDDFEVRASNSGYGLAFPPSLPEQCIVSYDISLIQILSGGCTDEEACNFNENATCDDGSCDYSPCCPGPGCCDVGMHWDWELGMCQITNVADTNLDGCVQLNDLLDLLSAYGNCAVEESAWQCGDPLEYQGYDYATVQIGEQCWFAENCRYLPYLNEVENGSNVDPRYYVLYEDHTDLLQAQESPAYLEYGALYNLPAVLVGEEICPSGWHIPNIQEWEELGAFASDLGPNSLKDESWGGGASGFDARAAGHRANYGEYVREFEESDFWSVTVEPNCVNHVARLMSDEIDLMTSDLMLHCDSGNSVRCIQDSE